MMKSASGSSRACLWGDRALADVHLRLHTTVHTTAAVDEEEEEEEEEDAFGSPIISTNRNDQNDERQTGQEEAGGIGRKRGSTSEAARPPKLQRHDQSPPPPAREFRLHATELVVCSDYFKARITGRAKGMSRTTTVTPLPALPAPPPRVRCYDDPDDDNDDDDDAYPPPRWVIDDHVEEEELEAAEAVLRFAYTGTLGDAPDTIYVDCNADANANSDNRQTTVPQLLRMISMADRWLMPTCLAACRNALVHIDVSGYDIKAINAVLAHVACAPSLPSLPSSSRPSRQATHRPSSAAAGIDTSHFASRLLNLVGYSADEVCESALGLHPQPQDGEVSSTGSSCRSAHKYERLLELNIQSLTVYLSATTLSANSENSVLLLADLWMTKHSPLLSRDERRQVASCVRMGQLSHTYMYEVLPSLGWVEVTHPELLSLARFGAAGDTPGRKPRRVRAHSPMQQHLARSGNLVGPSNWYTHVSRGPKTASLDMGSFGWAISADRLPPPIDVVDRPTAAAAAAGSPEVEVDVGLESRKVFYHGFVVCMCLTREPAKKMGPGYCVGAMVSVVLGGASPFPYTSLYARAELRIKLRDTGLFDTSYGTRIDDNTEGFRGSGAPLTCLRSLNHMGEAGKWEDHLVDGVMTVKCTVFNLV